MRHSVARNDNLLHQTLGEQHHNGAAAVSKIPEFLAALDSLAFICACSPHDTADLESILSVARE